MLSLLLASLIISSSAGAIVTVSIALVDAVLTSVKGGAAVHLHFLMKKND